MSAIQTLERVLIILVLITAVSCGSSEHEEKDAEGNDINQTEDTTEAVPADEQVHQKFIENLREFCGESFIGRAIFPQDENHEFYGKPLIMSLTICDENQIHIPLQVGEDQSRTWILTLEEDRLKLKHDHRHEDGSPEDLTMYGGYSTSEGTEWSQYFPADSETASMLPEASTNVWNMVIDKEDQTFEYILHRHDTLRFHAIFDISGPIINN